MNDKLYVELDEIAKQRRLNWPDFHPEDFCHRCGGRNLSSWSVESDYWNTAVGCSRGDILCPQCFVLLWEKSTGLQVTWQLIPIQDTMHGN